MNITTGRKLHRYAWTALPMPDHVIRSVHNLARRANSVKSFSARNSDGTKIPDLDDTIDDTDDSSYLTTDDLDSHDDSLSISTRDSVWTPVFAPDDSSSMDDTQARNSAHVPAGV